MDINIILLEVKQQSTIKVKWNETKQTFLEWLMWADYQLIIALHKHGRPKDEVIAI